MKDLLDFIEKHKGFFKKLIIFIVAYLVMVVINSPQLTAFFNQVFGEYITMGIKALTPAFVLTSNM